MNRFRERLLPAAAISVLLLGACSPGRDSVVPAPDSFPASTPVEDLAATYKSAAAYKLSADGEEFRVLIYRDFESDHRILVYRRNGPSFHRHGAEFNILGSLEPAPSDLCGGCIRVVLRSGGAGDRLVVTVREVDLVPEEGVWEEVR